MINKYTTTVDDNLHTDTEIPIYWNPRQLMGLSDPGSQGLR